MKISELMITPEVEAEMRRWEREDFKRYMIAKGDRRAWLDPDAGKPMPKIDLLPPNLCGFARPEK